MTTLVGYNRGIFKAGRFCEGVSPALRHYFLKIVVIVIILFWRKTAAIAGVAGDPRIAKSDWHFDSYVVSISVSYL